jgi:serine/threonine-protein kinase
LCTPCAQGVVTLPAGSVFAEKYRVVEPLGAGGAGVVYKVEHLLLHQTLALKLPRMGSAAGETDTERFLREARVISRFAHPNAVTVRDCGAANGALYMAIDFAPGRPLDQVLREGPLEPGRAVGIMRQVLGVMAAAHAAGIVHRDLKPANLVLETRADGSDFVRVLDFGIARVFDSVEEKSVTATGGILGTPAYLSPEQAAAEPVDARTDIYACGLILYEMLAGTRPCGKGATVMEEVSWKLAGRPPPPPSSAPNAAPAVKELDSIVLKALEKSREARFQTAEEFESALEGLLSEDFPGLLKSDVPSSGWPAARRRPASRGGLFLAVALAGAVVAAAAVEIRARRAAPPTPEAPPGMVLIPAGPFPRGTSSRDVDELCERLVTAQNLDRWRKSERLRADATVDEVQELLRSRFAAEIPEKPITLSSYYLDVEPVSEEEYAKFIDALPPEMAARHRPKHWEVDGRRLPELARHPVTWVSWDDADAYARWKGKRLPSEAEVERAARGAEGRVYPWGPQYEPDRVWDASRLASIIAKAPAKVEPEDQKTWLVEHFFPFAGETHFRACTASLDDPCAARGASPEGVRFLSGNVAEWCADAWDPRFNATSDGPDPLCRGPEGGAAPVARTLRGGSWQSTWPYLRAAARRGADPARKLAEAGFRCARDARR